VPLVRPTARESSLGRRRAVLRAALECFAERGFDATTLKDIRKRSGASTGSIYHHFASKEGLGAALYVEGLRDYQRGLVRELARHGNAERGVKSIVAYHLRWVERHPEWARFLLTMRQTEFVAAAEPEIAELNRALAREVLAWFAPHVDGGTVARLPFDLSIAILVGPSQEFARHWLAGTSRTTIRKAARSLAEAAWQAVRGSGTRASR
jgi:AcrR family transcriptional regulator